MADKQWSAALTAAVIDQELNDATDKASDVFSRDHIVALRNAGCTRSQVREYLISVFGNGKVRRAGTMVSAVDHVMGDLNSYGDWRD